MTKKNTITVNQSNKLGFKLTDVKTGLQALRNHANTLMLAKRAGADNGLLRYETDNFLETVFEMVEIYSNELDRVAFYLLECDNPEELRAYEAEEKESVMTTELNLSASQFIILAIILSLAVTVLWLKKAIFSLI